MSVFDEEKCMAGWTFRLVNLFNTAGQPNETKSCLILLHLVHVAHVCGAAESRVASKLAGRISRSDSCIVGLGSFPKSII